MLQNAKRNKTPVHIFCIKESRQCTVSLHWLFVLGSKSDGYVEIQLMFMKCQCTDVCHIIQWEEGLFQCSCMGDRTLNADGYTCSGEQWVIGNYLPHVRRHLFIQVLWSSDTFYLCLELTLIYYHSMFSLYYTSAQGKCSVKI